jgi:hypothetical protein
LIGDVARRRRPARKAAGPSSPRLTLSTCTASAIPFPGRRGLASAEAATSPAAALGHIGIK